MNRSTETGPFDLIGDIHGCAAELRLLLEKLGYREKDGFYSHPAGRRVVFLGDLVNRGPASIEVVRLAARMVENGTALSVRGNHCQYVYGFFKKYQGNEYTRARPWLEGLSPADFTEFSELYLKLMEPTPPYLILDGGRLVAAHAGIEAEMPGNQSRSIFEFCLYGETTSDLDPVTGYPKRRDWAATYRGKPFIAYGHTPTRNLTPEIRNNTVNLDQGCVYGGRLSALRYPEIEFVQVDAAQSYAKK
ncbi:MAG: hypothetical protein BGO39_12445 [Chloroflexi bacterium 54-19]|nr:MAG: hypothetical protein BGO39_12445 [Chloroflexi bacterium 54-19]